MTQPTLNLTVQEKSGERALSFPVKRLVCSGWVGRDRAALQAHIDELAELGVGGPTRTPIFMNFPPTWSTHRTRSRSSAKRVRGKWSSSS